jgi:Flp pilus assembly protein TadB
MTMSLIGKNIEREDELMKKLVEIYNEIEILELSSKPDSTQTQLLMQSAIPLLSQLKIVNSAIPELIRNLQFYKDLSGKENLKPGIINVQYNDGFKKEMNLAIKKSDEKKFLENLSLQDSLSKKIKGEMNSNELSFTRFFLSQSNKFFGKLAYRFSSKNYFESIKIDLRKSTSPFLLNTYLSMMFFSTALVFIFGLILGLSLMFFGLTFSLALIFIIFLPLTCFLLFFIYPSSKRKSLDKGINQELPFVTIYMSAIATSGIEPSKIFSILVSSHDYPFIQREVKKLNNLINFYGYDLVSALKTMSKTSPSERLAQLFDGLATTITSGGELTEFLNKHSETLLFDYRLERERYTKVAETFMNIYISVVIAAPMIMMMLFILMSLTQMGGMNLGPSGIGFLTTLVITLLNIGFLVILNMKQPKF